LAFVLLGMVIGEGGFMLSNVPLTIVGSGSAGEDERGLAAGLLNTSMQLGNAWGLGVVATVVAPPLLHWAVRLAAPKLWSVACGGGFMPAWALLCWPCQ
jgi:hypothetical protein